MSTWSDWNYINVFFALFSAYIAVQCFREGRSKAGWVNLFASSLNAACVAARLL